MASAGSLNRRSFLRSQFWWSLGMSCGAAGLASAHPADEGGGVQLSILSTAFREEAKANAEQFDLDVAVFLRNMSGEAVTLRGIDPPPPARARIQQRLRVLGAFVERETAFLRIDPGESLVIEPPEGWVLVEGLTRAMLEFNGVRLRFDFGPMGAIEALARLPLP